MEEITTPSFQAQLDAMLKESGETTSDSMVASPKRKEEDIELDPEDLSGLIEMPFDTAAMVTDFKGFELTEKESAKLCKLYIKPIKKLAEKYGATQLSIVLAATTTMSIVAGKYVEYKMWAEHQTRNEGKGKDELNKG